jgi:hypothetical protein
MNRALPIVSLCVAILALAGAFMQRDAAPPAPPPPPEPQRAADADPELRRRLEQLEDDNRALWDRVAQLERGRANAATDGGAAPPSLVTDVAQLREEVRSVMTGEVLSTEAGRAALKEVLKEADEERQRERQTQQQQRAQQRAAEQAAKWKAFVTAAKLTYAQEQELTRRLAAEDAARQAMTAQLQTGGAPGTSVGEAMRALRDQQRETDKVMTGLLDDAQKEQYKALRRDTTGAGRARFEP